MFYCIFKEVFSYYQLCEPLNKYLGNLFSTFLSYKGNYSPRHETKKKKNQDGEKEGEKINIINRM